MDPFPRQQRLVDLRQKLAALTIEFVKTEEELANLEADGQLNLGATPASAVQIPRTPAEKVSLFMDLFGMIFDYLDHNHAITSAMFRRRLAGYRELNYSVEMPPGNSTTLFGGDNPS